MEGTLRREISFIIFLGLLIFREACDVLYLMVFLMVL